MKRMFAVAASAVAFATSGAAMHAYSKDFVIVTVAQGSPGAGGKHRLRMSDSLIQRVAGWAEQRGWLLFVDIQIGRQGSGVPVAPPRLGRRATPKSARRQAPAPAPSARRRPLHGAGCGS